MFFFCEIVHAAWSHIIYQIIRNEFCDHIIDKYGEFECAGKIASNLALIYNLFFMISKNQHNRPLLLIFFSKI